ncbi:hypothetical protein Tco_0726463 [Tanacetum coccineum]|uniref:Uncharacterized protein n=1 Tax=Tanacetum coccineum TaxID=301880 RepID=A0ABQ4YI04_9ASTR
MYNEVSFQGKIHDTSDPTSRKQTHQSQMASVFSILREKEIIVGITERSQARILLRVLLILFSGIGVINISLVSRAFVRHTRLESDPHWVPSISSTEAYWNLHDSVNNIKQTLAVMSSASSAVTYTSVYTDSEPGRVFWGADEEVSDGGSPRVIVLGYDGLPMQPVAPPSPDYIPDSEDPQTPPVP